MDAGVVAILGHSYSSTTVKAYPLVTGNRTLLLSAYTAAGSLSGKDDLFLRTSVDTALYGEKTAALLREKGARSIVFLMDMSNQFFVLDYRDRTAEHFSGTIREVHFNSKQENDWGQIATDLLTPDLMR